MNRPDPTENVGGDINEYIFEKYGLIQIIYEMWNAKHWKLSRYINSEI